MQAVKVTLVEPITKLGIPTHKRQAQSPDLNSIENFCKIMKQQIMASDHFPGTVEEMRRPVQEEWYQFLPSEWNSLIESMPEAILELQEVSRMGFKPTCTVHSA